MFKEKILKEFELFSYGHKGLEGWFDRNTDKGVFQRLGGIQDSPLTKVQLNQLLVFGHEAPVSDDFFRYYWLEAPETHPYDVSKIPGYDEGWFGSAAIRTFDHLKWGMYRLFVDGLLYFGNVRTAYQKFRSMDRSELDSFFSKKRFRSELIKTRGPALPLEKIEKDDRYLVSEQACKSYGDDSTEDGDLKKALIGAFLEHSGRGGDKITIKQLIEDNIPSDFSERKEEFLFSAVDILDEYVSSKKEIEEKCDRLAVCYFRVREAALRNTQYYLSMVNDLDVYVATGMRTREDFLSMANDCDTIFSDKRLRELQLRYFDPTLSAAAGHEDKGIIECLMVKCARALVYCAGDSDSYGKAAEAAMGLSLGKPVIFYCSQEQKKRFYRDVHPLSRLIEFESGVAVGAMVTDSLEEVSKLLYRIFENKMEYILNNSSQSRGYLRLIESVTGSVVRLQINDRMLSETFWNHYHSRGRKSQGA